MRRFAVGPVPGYGSHVQQPILEPLLHSVSLRSPWAIGPHDGFYGMAVTDACYLLCSLLAPGVGNYMRAKVNPVYFSHRESFCSGC